MAEMVHNFAFPLWSLVDQAKVEAGKSDMRGLAKELGKWLAHNFDVDHKGVAIEEPSGTEPGAMPMFVVLYMLQVAQLMATIRTYPRLKTRSESPFRPMLLPSWSIPSSGWCQPTAARM